MYTIVYGQVYHCGYIYIYITLFYLLLYTYVCFLDKSGMCWASSISFISIRIIFPSFFQHFGVISG